MTAGLLSWPRMRSSAATLLQVLEGAEDCLLSSSGMNAATTMLLALVPAGGHIVTTTDCYRRTRQFIQTVLPKMGITATVSSSGASACISQNNPPANPTESPLTGLGGTIVTGTGNLVS